MTKKDYIILASALKDSKPEKPEGMTENYKNFFTGKETAWGNDVISLCNSLALDNPRFNRAKFLQACGYND